MKFTASSLLISGFLAPLALAGYNCKCQDENGQYNDLTEQVCGAMKSQQAAQVAGIPFVGDIISIFTADATYHGDQHHQCSSHGGSLDSGGFVEACKKLGVGGAFCWK